MSTTAGMMKRVLLMIFISTLLTTAESFRKEVEELFNNTNMTMTEELQKNLDTVKSANAPKGIRDIFNKKGEEFKKLEEVFTKKCDQELGKKLKDINDTVRAHIKGQLSQVHELFEKNFERFRDIAAAEHYREVKPFYDMICAIRLIGDTLENVRHKKEYGGVSRTRALMAEMNKAEPKMTKEEKSPSAFLTPPHQQFYKNSSDYVVPGEKRHEVDVDYDKWRLYVTYELNKLATDIRKELESMRGERPLEDIVAEFSFVMAKLFPFAQFVRRDVFSQVRLLAEKCYGKEAAMSPFLDELPKWMPNKRWYFPKQYLEHFNVLRRALGRRELTAREYRRDDMESVIPSSDDCFERAEYQGIYEYVNMYFSTTPKLTVVTSAT